MACNGVEKKTCKILRLFGTDIQYDLPESEQSSRVIGEPRVCKSPEKSRKRKSRSSLDDSSKKKPKKKKPKKEKRPRRSKEEMDRIGADGLELPREITQKIESLQSEQSRQEKKPRLLMQKFLSQTDLDDGQSRLLIPRGRIKDYNFVNEQEERTLHGIEQGRVPVTVLYYDKRGADGEEGIVVQVTANLRRWPKPETKSTAEDMTAAAAAAHASSKKWNYALQTVWTTIKDESKLGLDDKIQVWWFRHGDDNEHLGFVVRKVS